VKLSGKHIIFISSIWLCSVVSLFAIIPLHFFVKEHKSACELHENENCTDKETRECEICAFDLYIGYPQHFKFEIKRTDILLSVFDNKVIETTVFKIPFYAQLRAPPVTNVF
jgi:hypothetical protein